MKIDMMSVIDIINKLKDQDTPECNDVLEKVQEIFGPLLEMNKDALCAPIYNIEVEDDLNEESNQDPGKEIDWEQRRYELVKDMYVAHMQSIPNFNRQNSEVMKNLLIHFTRQADFIIEALKQDDLTNWKGSLYI